MNREIGTDYLLDRRQVVAVVGCLVQIFGVFTPILSVPILGNVNSFASSDGKIILLLAGLSLILAVTRLFSGLWVTGGISLAVLFFFLLRANQALETVRDHASALSNKGPFGDLASSFVAFAVNSVQLQWGWIVLIIGIIIVLVSAAINPSQNLSSSSLNSRTPFVFNLQERTNSFLVGVVAFAVSIAGVATFPEYWHGLTYSFLENHDNARAQLPEKPLGTAPAKQGVPLKRIHTAWPTVTFLGFSAGESPDAVEAHAAALGLQSDGDCVNRADDNAKEYTDCNFSSPTGESLGISLYRNQLQRIVYSFDINRYDEMLQKLTSAHGQPRIAHDPYNKDYEVSKDWGGSQEKYDIDLLTQVNDKGEENRAIASAVFEPRDVQ